MVRRPRDQTMFFENGRRGCGEGLVVKDSVLLLAGVTVGDVESLVERVREERIGVISGVDTVGSAKQKDQRTK
ncbi:hypothetical protein [Desulfovibrio sp. TomC]|uniref:hypothetical protein n=1 Tax=Desulfovibrio sp. TomC TaxID=1562888 RepID=UPI0005BCF0E2|nr:hypothetical protein [Desulfovibrio sp. TomC]